jgi:hypothetical protein
MRLDAGVRRQSTRVTIINGPQPALAQASDGPCRAVERAPHSWKAAHPWPGPVRRSVCETRQRVRLRHKPGRVALHRRSADPTASESKHVACQMGQTLVGTCLL